MTERHLMLDLDHGPADLSARRLSAAIANGRRARNTARRSHSTTPMSVRSLKMREDFATDSPGEAEAVLLADVLERVVAFRPQVVEVRYSFEGRTRTAFPDVGVRTLNGSVELWEVKSEKRRERGLVDRLGRLKACLRGHGIGYRVRTELWLRSSPRLENARWLRVLAQRPVAAWIKGAIADGLRSGERERIGDLRAVLGIELKDMLAAAARGWIAVDIDTGPLGDGSAIRQAEPGAVSGGYDRGEEEG